MKKKYHSEEELHRSIIQTAIDGFWLTDARGKLLEVNDAYCRMSGYTEEELLTMNITDLEANESPQDVQNHIQKIIQKGSDRFETKHRHKDGMAFDVEISVQFHCGDHEWFVCFLRDISEQKQAEQLLIDSQAKLKNTLAELEVIYKSAPVVLLVVDRDRRVERANQFALNFARRLLDEIIGLRGGEALRCMHHIDSPEGCGFGPDCLECNVRNAVLDTFRTQSAVTGVEAWLPFEENGRKKDFCFLVNTAYLQFDDAEKVLLCAQDITDRKKNEIALQESEEKFRLTFDSSPDSVSINSMDGTYIEINKGFTRLTGYSKEDFAGKTPNEINIWCNPPDRETLIGLLKEKGICENLEYTFSRKDGSLVTALMSARIITINNEPHILSITRDIQERITAEQKRLDLEKRLYQAQKMEAIGHLAGGVAHEFNNLLGIIMGNNELITEDLAENGWARESATDIHLACLRARDIIKQLLTFSRKDKSKKWSLDLREPVEESLKFIRATVPTTITIENRISQVDCPIYGDATQISQVVINLLKNSVDAVSDTNGKIEIELAAISIGNDKQTRFAGVPPGDYHQLSIADNGTGIREEDFNRIFEPYYTTKDIGEGSGIGLSVVHGIIEGHDGQLIVESTEGEGAIFTVLFPKYSGDSIKNIEAPEVSGHGKEHILLIDDEPSLVRLGNRLLTSMGYTVSATSDPQEAIEWVRKNPGLYDVVITDMSMPGMPGDILVKHILDIKPDLPTIICTGYSSRISNSEAAQIGAKGFLMKPLTKSELASSIRDVLK